MHIPSHHPYEDNDNGTVLFVKNETSTHHENITSLPMPQVPLSPVLHNNRRIKRNTRRGSSKEEHDEEKCYFHKLRKTSQETQDRPVFSQVKGCGGPLKRSFFQKFIFIILKFREKTLFVLNSTN